MRHVRESLCSNGLLGGLTDMRDFPEKPRSADRARKTRTRTRTRAVRPGPGSLRLLGSLGRLGVAGVEPLALALGLHERTVYSHLERLERAGLVTRVPVTDGGGGVAVLTRAGARACRESGRGGVVSPRSTAPSSARHGRAVSWVAASAEVQGWRWLGPAELRGDDRWRLRRDDGARHLPDLGLIYDGNRIAVEVELQPKAPARLRAILRAYRHLIDSGALTAVAYVTDRPDVTSLVEREGRAAMLGAALQVGPLEAVVADHARREAAAMRSHLPQIAAGYSVLRRCSPPWSASARHGGCIGARS